ncbi:hypothetical protein EV182_001558, partial [Spiromyces aspiralis]
MPIADLRIGIEPSTRIDDFDAYVVEQAARGCDFVVAPVYDCPALPAKIQGQEKPARPLRVSDARVKTPRHGHHKLWSRWHSEPVKCVLLPTTLFVPNEKQYPVLRRDDQQWCKKWMEYNVTITVREIADKLPSHLELIDYVKYVRYLSRSLPQGTNEERAASEYWDIIQTPLQPLMSNLDSSTYEVFEQDSCKYIQYEEKLQYVHIVAVSVVMVFGAGRGPLVNRSINASRRAGVDIKLYALEKNPNLFVTLELHNVTIWDNKVELVYADMRKWEPVEK